MHLTMVSVELGGETGLMEEERFGLDAYGGRNMAPTGWAASTGSG